VDALVHSGGQTFCWRYENGRAVRTELETGVSDGSWVEVTNRRVPDPPEESGGESAWTPIDGSEQVILGDLSILTDGASVRVAPEPGGAKVAGALPTVPQRVAGGGPSPTGGR
jgi:hypothetical protein